MFLRFLRIDNIFLARKGFLNFDVGKLISTCVKLFKPTHYVIYDILLFRGIYLVPRVKKKDPSFIVFRTGSLTLMSNKVKDILNIEKRLKHVFSDTNLR